MIDGMEYKPDAIIYIPGLGHKSGQVLDDTALRIASALDFGARTAKAEFSLKAGQDEDYVSLEGRGRKTRMRTICRVEPNKEDTNVIDVYEFGYIDSLTKGYVERNVLANGFRLLVALIQNFPRIFGAFRRDRKQKSASEKIQFIFAMCILSLLVVYLGFLGFAVVDTIRQAPQIQEMISQPDDTLNSAANDMTETGVKETANPQVDIRPGLTFFQLFVIVIASIEVFYPNAKQSFVDAAVRYISMIEYLGIGARHKTLSGQLLGLIDHVAARGYKHIHIVAYSFGTIIALDNLFPSGRAPSERIRDIHTLVTIGCPFDLIRVFWPAYFTERGAVSGVPRSWINVYSPIDVMASNFRNDSDVGDAEDKYALASTDDPEVKLIPSKNIVFASGRPKRALSLFELLTLVGLEAHASYWESDFEAEITAYSPVVEEIYKNDYPLS